MASLKDIKRRIVSVKSTQKITKAMKLVSAAKFAKATHAVQAARPYGKAFDQMVDRLVLAAGDDVACALKTKTAEKKTLVVVVGSDRGLCGALNSNVFKAVSRFLGGRSASEVAVAGWGRRPSSFVNKLGLRVFATYEKVLADTSYLTARKLSEELVASFESGEFDAVYIAYPRFKSAVEQEPTIKKLLPFSPEPVTAADADYLVEPPMADLLEPLIKRWIASTVHRVLLESAASEHGARMSAMENATNNAKEVTRKLTLAYNRARQAAITTELTEIISGAEAL